MLDAADVLAIKEMMKDAIEHDRATWRERAKKEALEKEKQALEKPEKEKERKLYLITCEQSREVGFPDEKGRVILNRSFYGWVTRILPNKGDWDQTIHIDASVEVISYGDGRKLDKPITMTLTHWTSMVEVQESVITGGSQ